MTREEKIKTILRYWELKNKKSKWFEEDKKEVLDALSNKTDEQLTSSLNNYNAMLDNKSSLNRDVRRELNKMDKAGLFNIKSMKPENQLD